MNAVKIALVGAGGRMGRLFADRLSAAGYAVGGVDRPLTQDALRRAVDGAAAVLLCVPVEAMDEVLRQLAPLLDGMQVLADITSVKVRPMQVMERHYAGPVVGTHPLFGPVPPVGDPAENLRVAVTPGDGAHEADVALVERVFRDMGCVPFRTTADEHDEAAACIQGLNFITSVAYLATLAHRDELTPFITPSFRRRLDAARKMLTEDASLFEGMFEANPHSQTAVRSYLSFLNFAAAGDVDVLVDRAQWWWRSHTERGGVRPS